MSLIVAARLSEATRICDSPSISCAPGGSFPLLAGSIGLSAQTLTSSTVVGTIVDSTGAAVPGAKVRIRQPETAAETNTTSGAAGDYRFPFLKPGEYDVTAEAQGLAPASAHVRLLVGQEQSITLTLGLQAVRGERPQQPHQRCQCGERFRYRDLHLCRSHGFHAGALSTAQARAAPLRSPSLCAVRCTRA